MIGVHTDTHTHKDTHTLNCHTCDNNVFSLLQQVKDFDDLSPMDQKALLRRTVPELVMLGFARASTPYDGMICLLMRAMYMYLHPVQ